MDIANWIHRDAKTPHTLTHVLTEGYRSLGFGLPVMAAEDTIMALKGHAGPAMVEVLQTLQTVIKEEVPDGSERRSHALHLIEHALNGVFD